MLNNAFTYRNARAFAERLRRNGSSPGEWIDLGFRLALARAPSTEEVRYAREMLSAADDNAQHRALTRFCLMLFNMNEFVFLD